MDWHERLRKIVLVVMVMTRWHENNGQKSTQEAWPGFLSFIKNTTRVGRSTALYAAYIVGTFDTADMVYSVDMVYTVDTVYIVCTTLQSL